MCMLSLDHSPVVWWVGVGGGGIVDGLNGGRGGPGGPGWGGVASKPFEVVVKSLEWTIFT